MPGIGNRAVASELFKAAKTTIIGEPVALYGTAAKALRHPIRSVLAVYHYDVTTGAKVFHSDYAVSAGQIARAPGSTIYDFNSYAITMTGPTYVLVTTPPRNPPIVMNFLTYVDYETDYIAPVNVVGTASPAVTRLIINAGDSITGAAHTIKREFANNDGDGYTGLLRTYFHKQFGVYNWSIDGSSIGQLVTALPSLLAMNPSVLTVAFGQNDHTAGPGGLSSFTSALNGIVDDCQSASVRVILIGFMPKNPLWVNYSLTNIIAYNDAIEDVATAQGVPFVDIYSAWADLRANKAFIELTGDNHHHPNNFGQRLYFSKILPYLLTGTVTDQSIGSYLL